MPSVVLGVLISAAAFAQQSSPRQPAQSRDSEEAARYRGAISKVQEALPGIPDRGAALFLLAKLHARLGELPEALALLKECVALDEGFDPAASPTFEPLQSNTDFQVLVKDVRDRHHPVHRARVAFTIPQKDLFPEGLAVDPDRHVFYMGSMHRRKIVRITEKGRVSDFVASGVYRLLPIGGIKVDADHGVWAASDNDHDSELLHFDAAGKLLERFPAPGAGPHVLNDLVLHGPHEIYVTDTIAGQVYRFDRTGHSFTPLTFPRPLLYPNGIAISDDGSRVYAADLLGVTLIDLKNNTTHEVDPGPHSTFAGIDGLYWYRGDLIGVQYGTGVFRVARWRLAPDGRRAVGTEILEDGTALVSSPTTGAIQAGEFYFISNTGIPNLQDDQVMDPGKLEPVHISVISLDR